MGETMAKKRDPRILKKICRKCNAKLPITDFYINRDWATEFLRDAWCKQCVAAFCVDKESIQEYFKFNKRVWREELWEWVVKKIEEKLSTNTEYQNMSDLQKRVLYRWKLLYSLFCQSMNRIQYYRYSNEIFDYEIDLQHETNPNGEHIDRGLSLDYGKKMYSVTWGAFYTEGELVYLEDLFNGLQRDFKLENSAYLDYAKKVCKASLAMDRAFSDMCDGKIGADKKYKDFKDVFDQLSQSAKFAEKTRSENDVVGYGSLGEIIKKMENTGFLQTKITFPEDDVDKILNDYRWIISSVGEDI
jgi:hypothetical protein